MIAAYFDHAEKPVANSERSIPLFYIVFLRFPVFIYILQMQTPHFSCIMEINVIPIHKNGIGVAIIELERNNKIVHKNM